MRVRIANSCDTIYELVNKDVEEKGETRTITELVSLHSHTSIRDPQQLKNELAIGVVPQTRTENCMDEDVLGLNGLKSSFIAKHIDVADLQNLQRLSELSKQVSNENVVIENNQVPNE